MALTKTKLTLSIDGELIKRLHKFLEENPGHPSISSLVEQSLSGYIDYFAPVLERARNGDAKAAITLFESGLFRAVAPLAHLSNELVNLRTELEVAKTKKPQKSRNAAKKKSV